MRIAALAGALALLLALAPPADAQQPGFQRGFVLTGWSAHSYETPASDSELWSMAHGGSDHVAIFTQWFLDSPTSASLTPDAQRTPTDASILHAADTARKLNLRVVLKPQIGIRDGAWIGAARPHDINAFWASYSAMLLHHADLARRANAELLVIGTEMRQLSGIDTHRWRALIGEIRKRFPGRLTYAANYDEFDKVPFWDALDYIGIDAYFALADAADPAPPAHELAAAWRERGYLDRIAAASARFHKPVVFTEIGYRGAHAAATRPSDWRARDADNPGAQANAYRAFYDAVATQPWMAGVYWWEVTPDRWTVQDYSPLGKPAWDVVAEFNRAAAAR